MEVGDHLASINGLNAINLSIAEVCKILANVSNPNEIELTFLRYVGPYRADTREHQQGYEVIDPQISVEAGNRSGVMKLYEKASAASKPAFESPKRGPTPHKATTVPSPAKESTSPHGSDTKPLFPPETNKMDGIKENKLKKEQSVPPPSSTKKKKKKKFGFFRRKKKGEKNPHR